MKRQMTATVCLHPNRGLTIGREVALLVHNLMAFTQGFALVCLALVSFSTSLSAAEKASLPGIPEQKIAELKKEYGQWRTEKSSSRKRRRLKNVIRKARQLVEESPEAPNRYSLLTIAFHAQRDLLRVTKDDRNLKSLYSICTVLATAPDDYGEVRFEAEILLSNKRLSESESTYEDYADALAEILARYHGKPAEARILLKAVGIASELNAYELKERILERLDDRFMDNEEVIAFRRKLSLSNLKAIFKTKLTRIDGTVLRFPIDTVGHLCVMAFWSMKNQYLEETLGYIKDLQLKHPEQLDVFSFNVDDLPDGGKSKLTELGLDWEVMSVPGGRNSQVYVTYARTDPVLVLVDAYGRTTLKPSNSHQQAVFKKTEDGDILLPPSLKINESMLNLERFQNQIQAMSIGDFLIEDAADQFDPAFPPELMIISHDHRLSKIKASVAALKTQIPQAELQAIQDCFTAPPFRYRLAPGKALANYRKAEALCRKAIRKYAGDPGLWLLRNRRIISLLGMWQTAREPKYLNQAVLEAEASLATGLVRGADVVPHFCLAKKAFREGSLNPEDVLSAFVKDTGGTEGPASARAAAATLARLDTRQQTLYESLRDPVLATPEFGNPLLWSVRSFLLDRCQDYFSSGRGARWHIINHGNETLSSPMPEIELKTLEGRPLVIPRDTADKQTLLVFIEPPSDPKASFPVLKDPRGNVSAQDYIRGVMSLAEKLEKQKTHKEVNVITAFLSDDKEQIRRLMKENGWACQASILPGGLSNPMVRRLNILSADRVPNLLLIRRDGTIAWNMSGVKYGERNSFPAELAIRVHFERSEVEWGYEALVSGKYKEAKRAFSGPFLPDLTNRFHWRGPRYHGLTLSHIAQKDWNASLESVDVAIFEHMARHCHGIPKPNRSSQEQKSTFGEKVLLKEPCDIISELWRIKTMILEQLKRHEEAVVYRKLAAMPAKKHIPGVYESFHMKLTELTHRKSMFLPKVVRDSE